MSQDREALKIYYDDDDDVMTERIQAPNADLWAMLFVYFVNQNTMRCRVERLETRHIFEGLNLFEG